MFTRIKLMPLLCPAVPSRNQLPIRILCLHKINLSVLIFLLSVLITASNALDSIAVKQVQAGGRHSCAILSTSELKCWGWNGHGQLGLGDTINRGDDKEEMGDYLPFVDLGDNEKVKEISVGSSHTCAISEVGLLKCWGWNKYGQLGLRNVKRNRGVAEDDMGENLPPFNYTWDARVKQVSAGQTQTCAIFRDDSLGCWGRRWNPEEQISGGRRRELGEGSARSDDYVPIVYPQLQAKAKDVAVGDAHTCATLTDNTLKCWGWNAYGQLGQGDTVYRGIMSSDVGAGLSSIDLNLGSSQAAIGEIKYVAKQLSAGYAHTCAVFEDNALKCWGWNYDGQLGYGDKNNRGDEPDEMGSNLPEVDVGSKVKVTYVAVGYYHTCALLSDASLKCWGANNYGQLGQGDTINRGTLKDQMGDSLPPVDFGGRRVKQVSAGFGHTCVILDDDSVKCFGLNDRGQLGLGDSKGRGDLPTDMGNEIPVVELMADRSESEREIIIPKGAPASAAANPFRLGCVRTFLSTAAPMIFACYLLI